MTLENHLKDRKAYLELRMLPEVKFFEYRGISLGGITSSYVQDAIDQLGQGRQLSEPKAITVHYDLPVDLYLAREQLTLGDRIANFFLCLRGDRKYHTEFQKMYKCA